MNEVAATPGAAQNGDHRSASFIVQWLRELEECREGGLLSDEEYAEQRAEKLAELLCQHRHLWVAWVAAAGSLAIVAGCVVWIARMDLQAATIAASISGFFGMIMLGRPCRDGLKQSQIRDRLHLLNTLLARDLITADEFITFEEQLHAGSSGLQPLGNVQAE